MDTVPHKWLSDPAGKKEKPIGSHYLSSQRPRTLILLFCSKWERLSMNLW